MQGETAVPGPLPVFRPEMDPVTDEALGREERVTVVRVHFPE